MAIDGEGSRVNKKPLWLAMGVLVAESSPPFRRMTPGLPPGSVEWRYISTREVHNSDARYVVVPCPDVFLANTSKAVKTAMGFQFSCFCKTTHWFRSALELFARARFIGKMEDDSVLYDDRVLAELVSAYYRTMRISRQPLLWYGHFDWSVHMPGTLNGIYCASGDNVMLTTQPPCNKGRHVASQRKHQPPHVASENSSQRHVASHGASVTEYSN